MEHVQLTWLSYHFMSRTQYWILLISYAFQSVTKNLSLGTEAFWLGQQRKSGVGVVARYDTKKWVSSVMHSFKLYMFTMSSTIRFLILELISLHLGTIATTFRNYLTIFEEGCSSLNLQFFPYLTYCLTDNTDIRVARILESINSTF